MTFTAYFDASRKKKEAITMAGFVSEAARWESNFDPQWRALLPPSIPTFHMTDFVSYQRGWESWRHKGGVKRARFIEDLVCCIRDNTRKGFAVTLQFKDYDDVNKFYTLSEAIGSPYSLVGMGCAGLLRVWAEKKRIDYRKILCIVESGDPEESDLIRRLRHDGFNAIPQSKDEIRAFDAGDLAAWRARALVNDGIVRKLGWNDHIAADRILTALDQLESIVQFNGTMGFIALRKLALSLGAKRRSTPR